MPRKITSGRVGGQILGSLSTATNTVSSVEPNANIALAPNGTGIVEATSAIQVNASNEIRFADSDSNRYAAIKAPGTIGTNYSLTLPADSGSTGEFLQVTNGTGTLDWAAPAVSITNQAAATGTYYPTLITVTSGTTGEFNTSSTKLSFVPSSGTLTATNFSGSLTGNVTSTSVNIDGGAIDGTTVGGNTPAAGTFTSITETSSIEYKENVNPITDALTSILSLNGVTYDRKDASEMNEAGLIAEEVHSVLPNLVKFKEGKPDSLHYTKLTAYLIEAVKSLKLELDELKGNK